MSFNLKETLVSKQINILFYFLITSLNIAAITIKGTENALAAIASNSPPL